MSKNTLPTRDAQDLACDLIYALGAQTLIEQVDQDTAQILVDDEHKEAARLYAAGWLAARRGRATVLPEARL